MSAEWDRWKARNAQLKGFIANGLIGEAIQLVHGTEDHQEGEMFVSTVLGQVRSTPELVNTVLEAFLASRQNRFEKHGYWVHSLSHFIGDLWERRLDVWIKKFHEVSFRGANELCDPNCSDRLVEAFAVNAEWNDDSADFCLTPENLRWMKWEYSQYEKARVEVGHFESEEAFLRWKLGRSETHIAFDYEVQMELIKFDVVQSIIRRLCELGVDVSEFNDLQRDLLLKQLEDLERKLSSAAPGLSRERLEKAIQKTRAAQV